MTDASTDAQKQARLANLAKGRQTAAANRAARKGAAAPPMQATEQPPAAAGELEGLSREECCFDCTPDKCLITGSNHCGHPHKGGLQAAEQARPDIVARYNKARRILARQLADKKT